VCNVPKRVYRRGRAYGTGPARLTHPTRPLSLHASIPTDRQHERILQEAAAAAAAAAAEPNKAEAKAAAAVEGKGDKQLGILDILEDPRHGLAKPGEPTS
jgi:hypothetical protein